MNEGVRIEKPITVVFEETQIKLANIINESGLPAFATEFILTELLNQVHSLRQLQYKSDSEEYIQATKSPKQRE